MEELVEKVGAVMSCTCMIESGQMVPNLEMLFASAEALEMQPAAFI